MDRLGVAVGLCWFSCLWAVVWVNLGCVVLGSALVSVCMFEWLVAIWFKFYNLGVNDLLLTCLGCWVALGACWWTSYSGFGVVARWVSGFRGCVSWFCGLVWGGLLVIVVVCGFRVSSGW